MDDVVSVAGRGNPVIKLIRRLGKDADARKESGLMLCDGLKLLSEALDSGLNPVHVVIPSGYDNLPSLPSATQVFEVPVDIFESLSPLKTPRHTVFTVPLPDESLKPLAGGRHIVLDCVQDPGNVGSIIRTARAFGVDTVILTDGCAELSNPKTVRAAMGAVFCRNVMRASTADVWQLLIESGLTVYATGTRGGTFGNICMSGCAVVIGSEGRGLSDFWLDKKLQIISIPMSGGCESLGAAVAAALIMWEMNRRC